MNHFKAYINPEVLEEMKKGVKEISHFLAKITQNMDQLSKQWQEYKKEIIQENENQELVRLKEDQEFNQCCGILQEKHRKDSPKENRNPTVDQLSKEEKMSEEKSEAKAKDVVFKKED